MKNKKHPNSSSPVFSVISKGEIVTGVKRAKNRRIQIKIFAELCCCTVADIEKILKEAEGASA